MPAYAYVLAFVAVYYAFVIGGLAQGQYRLKSDFRVDMIPFFGVFRVLCAKYDKLY